MARAEDWLRSRAREPVTIVGARLDAAAEIARQALAHGSSSGSLGWERTTLSGLAASLARAELVRRDLAPASALALEAVCARIVHDHADALGRFAPIGQRPGLLIGEMTPQPLQTLEKAKCHLDEEFRIITTIP